MNKRYIDFVPVDRRGAARLSPAVAKKPVAKKSAIVKPAAKKPVAKKPASAEVPIIRRAEPNVTFSRNAGGTAFRKAEPKKSVEEISLEEMFVERVEPAGVSAGLKTAKFGVIEDYRPKFVQTEVKKRPLGAKSVSKPTTVAKPSVSKDVAYKMAASRAVGVSRKGVRKPGLKLTASTQTTAAKSAGATRANFINVGKVEKRPLSKNVYTKKVAAVEPVRERVKEESKKPVMIIAKPEKDSKVGLIVAVILTIILGAAAGTVAFLLLPK